MTAARQVLREHVALRADRRPRPLDAVGSTRRGEPAAARLPPVLTPVLTLAGGAIRSDAPSGFRAKRGNLDDAHFRADRGRIAGRRIARNRLQGERRQSQLRVTTPRRAPPRRRPTGCDDESLHEHVDVLRAGDRHAGGDARRRPTTASPRTPSRSRTSASRSRTSRPSASRSRSATRPIRRRSSSGSSTIAAAASTAASSSSQPRRGAAARAGRARTRQPIAQAACIKATEDNNAVFAFSGSGWGGQGGASCVTGAHDTIYLTTYNISQEDLAERRQPPLLDSRCRRPTGWSTSPRTLDAEGAFDGKTIGVVMADSPGDPEIVEHGLLDTLEEIGRRREARRRDRLRRRQLVHAPASSSRCRG